MLYVNVLPEIVYAVVFCCVKFWWLATLNISADKRMTWEHSDLSVGDKDLAFEMFGNGAKPAEVMSALKVSKATAYRWQREWKEGRGDG